MRAVHAGLTHEGAMSGFKTGVVLAAGVVLMLSGTARAQDAFVPSGEVAEAVAGQADWETSIPGEQDYGTSSDVVYTAFAHDFGLFQGTAAAMNGVTAGLVCGTGSCGWLGGAQLPSGVQILGVELSACDGDAAQQVQFALFRSPKVPAGPTVLVGFTGTGTTATPGCTTFTATLATPHTVDNSANVYIMDVVESPGTNIEWNQFRIRYRRQVSPAPATATFGTDVPTSHPFFQYVEALAASGVTSGCGAGSYCPDQAVTRGQMAVFLSKALGLHFPN